MAYRRLMILILAAGVVLRLAAMVVQPLNLFGNDAASYVAMAQSAFAPNGMRDIFGNCAFYSPGYPFALAPFVIAFGAPVLLAVNLGLALLSIALAGALGRRIGGAGVGLASAAATAVLAPAALVSAQAARENLSIPLLLGFALAGVALLETRRPRAWAAVAGLAYGAGVLAGASVILTGAALPLALWWRGEVRRAGPLIALFALGTAAVLGPWLWHTQDQLGRAVLTTNAPFNLYIGNNPAANGRFVSMRDTPMARDWRPLRARAGELAATDTLGRLARAHIATHPGETAALALRKLALFWLPDLPEPQDGNGALVTLLRWGAAAEHLLLLGLAALALARWRRLPRGARLIAVIVALFWVVHAAAYVMPRYRLPVMPLVGVLAALALVPRVAPVARWRGALA